MERGILLIAGILLGASGTVGAASVAAPVAALSQDPVTLRPERFKVLLENDRVRLVEYRNSPGGRQTMHSHPDGVVYYLNDSKSKQIYPDGTTKETKFFSPTLLDGHGRRAFGRIYSFRDVVGLRTIGMLRKVHQIPLQELRHVGAWLHSRHDTPWSSLRFALSGRRIVFEDPNSNSIIEPRGAGQVVFPIALETIATEMRDAAARLRDRQAEQLASRLP